MAKEKNIGFETKINLIEISDAFRRHAAYKKPDLVAELVKETRRFAVISTYYGPMETLFHQDVAEKLRDSLTKISDIAVKLGASTVTLPFDGTHQNSLANFCRKEVIQKLDLPVKVRFQNQAYDKDLSHLGKVDSRVKTVLDEGVRGLAHLKHFI